jgi:hypothetical protein
MRCFASPEGRRTLGRGALVLIVLLVAPSACRQSDPARVAAERFLDLHYVEINLPGARDQASGLARAKIDEEIRLTDGQEPPESWSKPSVHYRFVEQQPDGQAGRQGFVYEATITLEGGTQFKRRVLLTVREQDGVWRVSNFQESD